jgi:hypothetical protein
MLSGKKAFFFWFKGEKNTSTARLDFPILVANIDCIELQKAPSG